MADHGVGAEGVVIGKNARGAWCVYIDGQEVSTHRTRDGAATSANNHIEAQLRDEFERLNGPGSSRGPL